MAYRLLAPFSMAYADKARTAGRGMAHSLRLPGALHFTQGIQQSGPLLSPTLSPRNHLPHSPEISPDCPTPPKLNGKIQDPGWRIAKYRRLNTELVSEVITMVCRLNGGRVANCWIWRECGRWGMVATHRRHDMTDDVWQRFRPNLPGGEGKRCRSAHDNRRFIDAVCWMLCTGAPWRDFQPDYGDWRTPTAASVAVGTKASGPGCWKR